VDEPVPPSAALEGVVAKRERGPYRPGERAWVKTKNRAFRGETRRRRPCEAAPDKRVHLVTAKPDDPRDWPKLSDDELAAIAHENVRDNIHAVEVEANRRLIVALREHKESADRAARGLEVLTLVLILATIALLVPELIDLFD
jgi:hypothetical protein